MKKIYALAALALVMFGCQKSELEVDNNPEFVEREIIAYGSISAEAADSKVYVDDNWGVYWSENQTLGAWTSGASSFAGFAASNEAGSSYAEFTGSISGEKLRFLHPYNSLLTIEGGYTDISLTEQSVDMDAPKSHLTSSMYMMSDEVDVVENVIESFEMKHIGSILNLNIKFDGILDGGDQANVVQVQLLGVPVAAKLNLNASDIDGCLSDVVTSEIMTATISNSPTVSDGGTVTVPLAVLPGEVSSLKVLITYFVGVDKYLLTKDISPDSPLTIARGSYHDLTLNCDAECDIQNFSLTGSGTVEEPYEVAEVADLELFAEIINFGVLSLQTTEQAAQAAAQKAQRVQLMTAAMQEMENLNAVVQSSNGTVSEIATQTSSLSTISSIQRTSELDDVTANTIYFKLSGGIDLKGDADNQWAAIGTFDNPFTGHFDGGGYTISGIYIDNSLICQGLFGYVGKDGIVKNLSVDGSISASSVTGSVVSWNEGTISNCWNIGDVNSTGNYIGGVVGINSSGTIINCYNTGSVSGGSCIGGVAGVNSSGTIINCYNISDLSVSSSNSHTGGVVGYNYDSNSTIINCYNFGSICGGSGSFLGGVAGVNRGAINNCYNTGGISGSIIAGGVAGINYYGTITNCFNTGSVSGSTWVGGVVGDNSGAITNCYNTGSVSGYSIYIGGVGGTNSGTITNCYWNGDVYYSGNSVSTSTGTLMDLASKTTSEMKKTDFVDLLNASQDPAPWVSDVSPNINSGYPILSWQVE